MVVSRGIELCKEIHVLIASFHCKVFCEMIVCEDLTFFSHFFREKETEEFLDIIMIKMFM